MTRFVNPGLQHTYVAEMSCAASRNEFLSRTSRAYSAEVERSGSELTIIEERLYMRGVGTFDAVNTVRLVPKPRSRRAKAARQPE